MLLFLWLASRGYRLRPWRSPYLRWRIETYSGIPAESLNFRLFVREIWNERHAMLEYVRWVRNSRRLLDG